MGIPSSAIIVGSRTERFTGKSDRGWQARKINGSNQPFAVLGAMLLWVGWFGFNGGSTDSLRDRIPIIIAHTVLSGAAGMVCAGLFGWHKKKKLRLNS